MNKHLNVKFTEKELTAVLECMETMLGMVGAMDDDFNKEQALGYNSITKALKRSDITYNRPDYKNSFDIVKPSNHE